MIALEVRMVKCEVFSFTDTDGSVRHWNVTAIQQAVMDGSLREFEMTNVYVTPECAAAAMRGGVEEARIQTAATRLLVPILVVIDHDGAAIIIDGNHRVIAAQRKGDDTVRALIFQISALRAYEIDPSQMITPEGRKH
jgi:hypothetical protein